MEENNKGRDEIERCGIEETAGFKNLIAIRDYTKDTREMFRKLEQENEHYKKQIQQLNTSIELLKQQMSLIQIKLLQINNRTE